MVAQPDADGNVSQPPAAPSPPPTTDTGDDRWGLLGDIHRWFDETDNLLLVRLILSVLIVAAAIFLARFMRRHLRLAAERTAKRSALDAWQTRALVSRTQPLSMVFGIVAYIAAFLVILTVWQQRTAVLSMLTAAGFLGIVVGLAASNSLSNLIAGFMIFYNHPFDIGDWVQIEDVQGIVLDVKPGATVIESWEGEKITFPNRIIDSSRIINKSHQRKLRWKFPVGVDYATDIEKARNLLLTIIKSHPEVLKDPEPQVVAISFGDSAINLEIRFWLQPLRAAGPIIQTWLMQEIQRAFAKEGIVIPFPQRTVVYRYPEGNPPPGETVSELAYDPETDPRPFPAPPPPPTAATSPDASRRTRNPFERLRRREPR